MKTRDKRHHSETSDEVEAEMLLEELAEAAKMQQTYMPSCRRDCRNTEHYHGKPGAFIGRLLA